MTGNKATLASYGAYSVSRVTFTEGRLNSMNINNATDASWLQIDFYTTGNKKITFTADKRELQYQIDGTRQWYAKTSANS